MSGKHDPYAVAGRAGRDAIDRALDANAPLIALRVLCVFLWHGPLWSKVSDAVPTSVIVRRTGMDDRTVRQAIGWLKANKVIEWTSGDSPKGGRRTVSRVTFPTSDPGAITPGGQKHPVRSTPGGQARKTPGFRAQKPPGSITPPSEKSSKDFSEDAPQRPSAGATGAQPAAWLTSLRDMPAHTHKEFKAHARKFREELHGTLGASGNTPDTELDAVTEYLTEYGVYLLEPLAEELAAGTVPTLNRPRDLLRLALDTENDSALAELGNVVETEGMVDREGEVSACAALMATGELPYWWAKRAERPYSSEQQ